MINYGAPRLKPWCLQIPPFAPLSGASEGLSASTPKGDIRRSELRIQPRLKSWFSAKADKKIQLPLIIILLVVALVLGQAIYKQYNPKSPTESVVPKLIPPDLTEDEKAVLNPPSPDAPTIEREKHDALAAKLAKESDSLDITNCRSNPLVLRIKINKNLKVKNSDNIDRKLIFDDTHNYKIAKNSTTNLKTDFGKGAGLYGYICEGVGLTGFILVTP